MCAPISSDGVLQHRLLIGPYNTEFHLLFVDELHVRLVPVEERGEMRQFVIAWDNVTFYNSRAVTEWFAARFTMLSVLLPPYSLFLNPTEELFTA